MTVSKTLNMRLALLVNMVRAGKLGVKSKEGFYDYSEKKKQRKSLNNSYKSRAGSRNFS
jgi:3-hydroxyacyl-CoA dehydrogenase